MQGSLARALLTHAKRAAGLDSRARAPALLAGSDLRSGRQVFFTNFVEKIVSKDLDQHQTP
jgi:hypothetical protein